MDENLAHLQPSLDEDSEKDPFLIDADQLPDLVSEVSTSNNVINNTTHSEICELLVGFIQIIQECLRK